MVRLDKAELARFEYLKSLRHELLHVEDEDGPLTRQSAKREWDRQIAELEALRETRKHQPAEPALAGSPS